MKQLFFSLLLLIVIKTASAQTTTGRVTYKMDISSDNPDMAMATTMMDGSVMDLFFSPDKSKMSMTLGMFMTMNTVVDVKADKSLMLMEVMGNKSAIETKLSELAKDAKKEDTKIETTTETKEIIGFKCKKAILKTEDGVEMIMWYTTDLIAALEGFQQFNTKGINGVPLEFATEQQGLKMHFTATKFEKTVDEKIFSLTIPEGYTLMSLDDLKNMSGEE